MIIKNPKIKILTVIIIKIDVNRLSNHIERLYFTEKIKRAQKVQATQTDGARDTSPATPHKIKSVMKKNTQQNEIPKSIIR